MHSQGMKIALIGAGNLASALAPALVAAGHHVVGVFSRTERAAATLAARTGCVAVTRVADLPRAEVYIFSVRDDALAALAESARAVTPPDALMIHTAGSVPMTVFRGHARRYGVLYPLQTFTKGRRVDFHTIPLFVEGVDEATLGDVTRLARSLSGSVTPLDSERRGRLHLAAVFASNFSNHCYAMAQDILRRADVDPRLLLPLIRETEAKAEALGALRAQTGPAVRYDRTVMQGHLDRLAGDDLRADIYRAMSSSIHDMATSADVVPLTSSPSTPMINYDLTRIKALAFDVDGVLSANNVVLIGDCGQPTRTANIKDGYALQLAVKQGLEIAIITGGRSEAVRTRYTGLGITNVFMGVSVKIACFNDWLAESGLSAESVLYMGDDIPDYEVMQACGLPCCPADAAPEIKSISTYVSDRAGGYGCVRDVVEQVLRAQGRWMADREAFGW